MCTFWTCTQLHVVWFIHTWNRFFFHFSLQTLNRLHVIAHNNAVCVHVRACMCVYVCVCVHACVCTCVRAYVATIMFLGYPTYYRLILLLRAHNYKP